MRPFRWLITLKMEHLASVIPIRRFGMILALIVMSCIATTAWTLIYVLNAWILLFTSKKIIYVDALLRTH